METEKQLAEVLRWWDETGTQTEGIRPSLGAVYLDAESLEEDLERLVGQVHSAELKAYVVLPAIFRKITRARYEKKLSYWQNLRADGYVIRNLEEYEYVRDKEWAGDLILDHQCLHFQSGEPGILAAKRCDEADQPAGTEWKGTCQSVGREQHSDRVWQISYDDYSRLCSKDVESL